VICLLLLFARVDAYGYKSTVCFSVYLQHIFLPSLIVVSPKSAHRLSRHPSLLASNSIQLSCQEFIFNIDTLHDPDTSPKETFLILYYYDKF
jgi:hypothetical protein